MLLNFERYFFPDKPDLYVIAFTTRLPKIKKKIIKAPKKWKIPKAYYYDFDFVCLRKVTYSG